MINVAECISRQEGSLYKRVRTATREKGRKRRDSVLNILFARLSPSGASSRVNNAFKVPPYSFQYSKTNAELQGCIAQRESPTVELLRKHNKSISSMRLSENAVSQFVRPLSSETITCIVLQRLPGSIRAERKLPVMRSIFD